MKHKVALALAFAGLSSISTASFAQAKQQGGTGWYAEGTVGRSTFDIKNTSGWSVDKTDTNWGVMVGYNFNENIAVEGGYRSLGETSGTVSGTLAGTVYGKPFTATGTLRASGDSKGWLIGPRFTLPVNDVVSLYAKGGLYVWDSDVKATVNAAFTWGGTAFAANSSASRNYDGTDSYIGVGALFKLNKQVGIGVGYTHFRHGGDIDTTVKSLEANVNIRF